MANFNIDYLVVAGGGGGSNELGGGGGAGGYLTNVGGTAQSLQGTITYTVVVGDGGRGGVIGAARDSENTRGGDGDNSSLSGSGITTITSTGGGGGGAFGANVVSGRNGGSGGGAAALSGGGIGTAVGLGNTPSTTPSQGNNGGNSYQASGVYPGGGGGGAGAVGGNYKTNTSPYGGGNGGDGLPNTITGASPTPYYAGGGGGNGYGSQCDVGYAGIGGNGGGGNSGIGRDCATANGSNGTNGLGGGGGSATYDPATQSGGSGGSGVVIIRYTTANVDSYTTTGAAPTKDTTTVAGQTILSFTTVGTGSITFTTPAPPFGGTKVTTPVAGFESAVDIGLKIPVGTNSNLPTGVEGMIRNDTDEDSGGTDSTTAITFYNGTDWKYFTSAVSQDSPPIENFNTVLYDGQSTDLSVTGVGFQPDLVWVKCRDVNNSHVVADSVRGGDGTRQYVLFPNLPNPQSSSNQIKTIDDDGFTVFGNRNATNRSPQDYVAWCFKAGGLINKAADFNGSSSIIKSTALGAAFRSQTTLSISAWFKTSQSTRLTIASFSDTNNGSTDLWLGSDSSGDTISFRNVNNGVNNLQFDNAGGLSIRDGAWHHVVFTADSSGTRIYVDGSELTVPTYQNGFPTTTIEMPTSLNQFSIGANEDDTAPGGQWFLNGQINQVRVFTSAVSASQVTELYNETKADNSVLNYPAGANCITAYPLGENANSLNSAYNGTESNVTFGLPGYLTRNNEGTIESTVSVNDTLGFSIAKYTGNTTSGATVGHGLSSTPELILFKTLESGPGYAGWAVQVASLGGDKYLILNESQQAYSGTGYFNDTLADSDVITLGSFDVTNDGTDIIAYSFASKPGFSKVGTYTGNGGNNPVDVGFEPAFVMIKNTTSSASWAMFDNKRTTANPSTSALYANEAIIEEDLQLYFEFTSTGFKNLQSSNTLNTSSSIYIYLAFAK